MRSLPDRRYIFSTGQIRATYGGLTIAMMRRAKLFAEAGHAVDVTTVDWWPGYAELTEEWRSSGVMPDGVRIRNIHDDFSMFKDPTLGTSSRNAEPHALKIPSGFRKHEHPADLGRKRYWYAPGTSKQHAFTEYLRPDGSVYMRTLSNPGAAEWGLPKRPVGVYDHSGSYVLGFPSHYAWWVFWAKHLITEKEEVPFVIQDIEDEQFFSLWKDAGACSVQFVHLSHTKNNSRYGPLKDRWYALQRREQPFNAVVIPTHWQACDWKERFGNETDIFVVPHFNVNWPDEVVAAEQRPARVVVVSRLVPEKHVDDALRIFAEAGADFEHASLHIYGDGPERASLEQLSTELGMSERIFFHGHSANGAAEFSTARAALFTSQAEGFGLTILEAMAHGAIPIAFNVRYGPSEMIDASNGYLVDGRSIEAAGEALREVLQDSVAAEKRSRAATRVAASFSEQNTLKAWSEVVLMCESRTRAAASRML